jgi:hypothetical protein
VKPPARKFAEEEMNQTMRVPDGKKTNDITEVSSPSNQTPNDASGTRRATTLDTRDETAK